MVDFSNEPNAPRLNVQAFELRTLGRQVVAVEDTETGFGFAVSVDSQSSLEEAARQLNDQLVVIIDEDMEEAND